MNCIDQSDVEYLTHLPQPTAESRTTGSTIETLLVSGVDALDIPPLLRTRALYGGVWE